MMPQAEALPRLRLPPALAGGPLLHLNRLLLGLARSRREGDGRLRLVLDEGLIRAHHRRVGVLNRRGDVVFLPGPENGVFDAVRRSALAAALVDTMPATREARAVVDRLLPAPGVSPLEASRALWSELLGPAGLMVEVGRPAGPTGSGISCQETGRSHPASRVTWVGVWQRKAREELRRTSEREEEGEGLAGEWEDFEVQCEEGLARLGRRVKEEEPRAFGAWHRLRREIRRANGGFRRRFERNRRNRSAIRGARLQALHQALRPLGDHQEEHLGLLAAAAFLQLDLDRLEEAVTLLEEAPDQEELLVSTQPLQFLD